MRKFTHIWCRRGLRSRAHTRRPRAPRRPRGRTGWSRWARTRSRSSCARSQSSRRPQDATCGFSAKKSQTERESAKFSTLTWQRLHAKRHSRIKVLTTFAFDCKYSCADLGVKELFLFCLWSGFKGSDSALWHFETKSHKIELFQAGKSSRQKTRRVYIFHSFPQKFPLMNSPPLCAENLHSVQRRLSPFYFTCLPIKLLRRRLPF